MHEAKTKDGRQVGLLFLATHLNNTYSRVGVYILKPDGFQYPLREEHWKLLDIMSFEGLKDIKVMIQIL